jgi:hypothetical protein
MTYIKLIWDFKGAESAEIARHHCKHLQEYAAKKALLPGESGFEQLSENHHIAWLTVNKENMITTRDELRPHRGQQIG